MRFLYALAFILLTACAKNTDLMQYKPAEDTTAIIIAKTDIQLEGRPIYGCSLRIFESTPSRRSYNYKIDNAGLIALPISATEFRFDRITCPDKVPPIVLGRGLWHRLYKTPEEKSIIYIGDIHFSVPVEELTIMEQLGRNLKAQLTGWPSYHYRPYESHVEQNLEETLSLFREKTGDNTDYAIEVWPAYVEPYDDESNEEK